MSFFDTLHTLQRSSPKKRFTVLVVSVTLVMIVVIGIWVVQLRGLTAGNSHAPSFTEPFRLIIESFKENVSGELKPLYEKRQQ